MSTGIDYGMGLTNIDKTTGIRFGVIPMHDVTQAWCDSSESEYGDPHCPKCGNEAVAGDSEIDAEVLAEMKVEYEEANEGASIDETSREDLGYGRLHHCCGDYACDSCRVLFDGEDAFGDDPIAHVLDDGEYKATQGGDDCDIFILKAPFFTYGPFCSPCAPGAVYLRDASGDPEHGAKAYCFGHDWFEDGKAPYPVYSVATGELVQPE